MTAIQFINVTKEFQQADQTLLALNPTNLVIKKGEFVAIVGPDYYATSGPPIQSIESLNFHLESAYTHLESGKMSHARFSMAYS